MILKTRPGIIGSKFVSVQLFIHIIFLHHRNGSFHAPLSSSIPASTHNRLSRPCTLNFPVALRHPINPKGIPFMRRWNSFCLLFSTSTINLEFDSENSIQSFLALFPRYGTSDKNRSIPTLPRKAILSKHIPRCLPLNSRAWL